MYKFRVRSSDGKWHDFTTYAPEKRSSNARMLGRDLVKLIKKPVRVVEIETDRIVVEYTPRDTAKDDD